MGLCLEGHPRQPLGLLTPTVRAYRNLYPHVPTAFRLVPLGIPYAERWGLLRSQGAIRPKS